MEIFALLGTAEYELDILLGVYASEQEAHDAYGVYTRDTDHGFDSYVVERRVVGAPACIKV